MLKGLDKYYKMFSEEIDFNTNLIFEGDKSIGKFTFALEMVKSKCNNEMNIHVVQCEEGKQSISIEQIRKVFADINDMPYGDKKHYIIIDDAHTLNDVSANALLKRLEEPRKTELFILISSDISKMLETIKSRCFVIHFSLDYSTVEFKTETDKDKIIASVLKEQGMQAINKYNNDIKQKSKYNDYYSLAIQCIGLKDLKQIHILSDKVMKSDTETILYMMKHILLNTNKELYKDFNRMYNMFYSNVNKIIVIDVLISCFARFNKGL